MRKLLAAVAIAAVGATSPRPFAFSNTIGDDAVVSLPFILWGYGTPEASVSIAVSNTVSKVVTTVGADGIWRQAIAQLEESLVPIDISAVSQGTTIHLHGILVGHVILCSGQSRTAQISKMRRK